MDLFPFWMARDQGLPERHETQGPIRVGLDGSVSPAGPRGEFAPPATSGRHQQLLILPATVTPRAVAVVLVPEGLSGRTTLQGLPLRSGLHLLRHADCLEIARTRVWISGARPPRHDRYDPARDGEGVFCFRTKAPLRVDDPITFCPGPPERRCGRIYKADAWNLGLPCHDCGYDVSQPEWQPSVNQSGGQLDELLADVAHRRSVRVV